MANKNIDEIVRRLKKIPEYVAAFSEVFSTNATPTAQGTKDVPAGKVGHASKASSEEITPIRIYQAIASFERTILSGNSPFDRFTNGDKSAISESAQRGYRLFNGKANCAQCHTSFNFTDELYHNLGVGALAKKPDEGRYLLTRVDGQQGAFKTPDDARDRQHRSIHERRLDRRSRGRY
jgi:cytochrome c peroxidase